MIDNVVAEKSTKKIKKSMEQVREEEQKKKDRNILMKLKMATTKIHGMREAIKHFNFQNKNFNRTESQAKLS